MEVNLRNLPFDELERLCVQSGDVLANELLRRYYHIIKNHEDAVREAITLEFETADKQGALL
jgi:hypothetical protein